MMENVNHLVVDKVTQIKIITKLAWAPGGSCRGICIARACCSSWAWAWAAVTGRPFVVAANLVGRDAAAAAALTRAAWLACC